MANHRIPVLDITNKVPTGKLGDGAASASTFLRGDQTWATGVGETCVRKTSDQAVTGTSFADCSELSFSGEINSEYIIEFQVIFSASAPTVGINLGINAASGSMVSYLYRASSGVAAEQVRFGNSLDNALNTTTASASTALNMAVMSVWLKTSATLGSIVLRFAAETAAGVITIKAGSVMKYRKTY